LRIEIETAPAVEANVAPDAPSKKSGWLPLLVVLFLASYALMTMLIVEQGRTIDSQRTLIRELFRDSNELAAVKTKAQEAAPSQTAINRAPSPQVKSPSTQMPEAQAPAKPLPSPQVVPQRRAQNQGAKQKAFQMPTKPASDLADAGRSLIQL
jgi:cytoskeletal protein RodZ